MVVNLLFVATCDFSETNFQKFSNLFTLTKNILDYSRLPWGNGKWEIFLGLVVGAVFLPG